MASSTSFETPLTVNDNSQNNYHCQTKLPLKFGSSSKHCEEKNKSIKNNTNRKVSAVQRRQFQKQDSLPHGHQPHKGNKRRYAFTGLSDHKIPFKRRRRGNSIVLPTKFLLGGNINDPLNLQSLADEEINRRLNEATPKSSPVPTPKHRTQVQVLIPPNINDPLNLNTGEEIEFSITPYKNRKRKRRKKEKHDSISKSEVDDDEDLLDNVHPNEEEKKLDTPVKIDIEEAKNQQAFNSSTEERVLDKIVSPVVPQGSPSKFHRRFHSKSVSRESGEGEKSGSAAKSYQKKHRCKQSRRGPQHVEEVRFREKDANFCFGNCIRHYVLHTPDIEDSRLRCLRKEWFENKTVMDIGCNVGHVTLHVARNFSPKKIVGIDIDDKLIKAARYNVNHYYNVDLSKDMDFPISMPFHFGPLSALALPSREVEATFPNNVAFLQDNYVLGSDELLETQKPEFDTILCMSVTKWVHLNYGDEGIKRVFRRIHAQLNHGGRLILEAQNWPAYSRKKKLTPMHYKNYFAIQMKPDKFNEYLLSKEVGFSTCEMIGRPLHPSQRFRRPIFLFTKGVSSPGGQDSELHSSVSVESLVKSTMDQDSESLRGDEETSTKNSSCLVGEQFHQMCGVEEIL